MYRDREIEGEILCTEIEGEILCTETEGEILCTECKKEQSGKGRNTVEGRDKVCERTSGRYRK